MRRTKTPSPPIIPPPALDVLHGFGCEGHGRKELHLAMVQQFTKSRCNLDMLGILKHQNSHSYTNVIVYTN